MADNEDKVIKKNNPQNSTGHLHMFYRSYDMKQAGQAAVRFSLGLDQSLRPV